MRAWWRSNRWFLVSLIVLVPVALVVSMTLRWFPYLERQPQPEAVPLGETVRYSGADIRLTELRVLDGIRWRARAGADIVVATVEVDVVEPVSSWCQVQIVSDEAGFERFWDASLYPEGDFEVADDTESLCSFSEEGAYILQLTFLVPAGQVEDPVLQISSSAALPRALRLS